jgi:DNA-directed RNA polymerase sigma subunit (sigma70/sigma32)
MKNKNNCNIKKCRYWLNSKKNVNCFLILSKQTKSKQLTLQEIGKIFNVTRMRICQIEKIAIEKIKNRLIKN